jgi:hypothetical protein
MDPRDHIAAEHVEGLFTALAVFGIGVAFGLTAFALHGGIPQCQTIGGMTVGPFCSRWAWGERMAYRAIQGSLLSFGVAFVAARWETVSRHISDWRGDGA